MESFTTKIMKIAFISALICEGIAILMTHDEKTLDARGFFINAASISLVCVILIIFRSKWRTFTFENIFLQILAEAGLVLWRISWITFFAGLVTFTNSMVVPFLHDAVGEMMAVEAMRYVAGIIDSSYKQLFVYLPQSLFTMASEKDLTKFTLDFPTLIVGVFLMFCYAASIVAAFSKKKMSVSEEG